MYTGMDFKCRQMNGYIVVSLNTSENNYSHINLIDHNEVFLGIVFIYWVVIFLGWWRKLGFFLGYWVMFNSTFISLIPKVDNPRSFDDFRPE
jgi:hypothetical protein